MKKIIYIFIFLYSFLNIPLSVFAVGFFFETNHALYGSNDTVVVDVLLDSEDIVNTISGTIQVEGIEDPKISINTGNSSILFWVDKPEVQGNSIYFSGITPGGIQGSALFLFSLEIRGQNPDDELRISTEGGSVLLHDGIGTENKINSIDKKIYISEDINFSQELNNPVDAEKPEDFTPIITQDENLYDGRNVLVFATQDKGVGILRYEVKEGYFGSFQEVQSPYVLKDQKLFKTIFVKAVDVAGNERISVVHPQEKIFDENFILIFSILIVVIVSGVVVYRKKHQ